MKAGDLSKWENKMWETEWNEKKENKQITINPGDKQTMTREIQIHRNSPDAGSEII